MNPYIPLSKFGLILLSVDPCIPPFKIQTDSAARGFLYGNWTDMAVFGSLHPPFKVLTGSAVRGVTASSLKKLGPIQRYRKPCIPFLKFVPIWGFVIPCIPL